MPFLRAAVLVGLALAAHAAPLPAQHGDEADGRPPRTYSISAISAAEVQQWRDDLQALVTGLERIHPDPYHRTSRQDFGRAVSALSDSIASLPAHRIVVGFARLVAMVGDGHTSLPLYFSPGAGFHILPYRLGIYEDGIYVEAADRELADLVGGLSLIHI